MFDRADHKTLHTPLQVLTYSYDPYISFGEAAILLSTGTTLGSELLSASELLNVWKQGFDLYSRFPTKYRLSRRLRLSSNVRYRH